MYKKKITYKLIKCLNSHIISVLSNKKLTLTIISHTSLYNKLLTVILSRDSHVCPVPHLYRGKYVFDFGQNVL